MKTGCYNPPERREACKGAKELAKKSAASQPSTRSSAPKHTVHIVLRSDAPHSGTANQTVKAARPSSSGGISVSSGEERAVFEKQITELKLSVDSLEKERDFYFAKLRDVEILSQTPDIENLPVVEAIKRILYASDEDASVVAEAQAMLKEHIRKTLGIIPEETEEGQKTVCQKRKSIVNVESDAAASDTLSPRRRFSEASDVHCSSESPLVTF